MAGAGLVAEKAETATVGVASNVWKVTTSFFDGEASNIFGVFTPKIGEDVQFDEYFSDGLKPPTSFFDVLLLETSQPFGFDVRHHVSSLSLGSVPWEEDASSIFLWRVTKNWKEPNFHNGFNVRITTVDSMFTFV